MWVLLLPLTLTTLNCSFDKLLLSLLDWKKLKETNLLLQHFSVYNYLIKNQISGRKDLRLQEMNHLRILGENTLMREVFGQKIVFDFQNRNHMKSYGLDFFNHCDKTKPNDYLIKLSKIYYRLKKDQGFLDGIFQINKLKKANSGITQDFNSAIVLDYLESIMQRKIESEDRIISLAHYIEVSHEYSKLREMIIEQGEYQIRFWNLYGENNVRFNELLDVSNKIQSKRNEISNQWNKFSNSCTGPLATPYYIYGNYLDVMNNTPTEMSEVFKKYLIFLKRVHNLDSDELDNDTMYHPNTIFIKVSALKADLGTITEISHHSARILKYERHQLIGKNIKMLIPRTISERHDNIMMHYFTTGISRVMDSTREMFLQDSEGKIIPIKLHITLNHMISKEVSFAGLFRLQTDNQDEFIIVNSKG